MELVTANELVGFLAKWAPKELETVANRYPDLQAQDFFAPGVVAGEESEERVETPETTEIILLAGRLKPVADLLKQLVVRGEEVQTILVAHLRLAARLRMACQILTALSSGGAIGLLSEPFKAGIACVVSLVSSLVAIMAQWRETNRGSEGLAAIILKIGECVVTAKLVCEEVDVLLPHIKAISVRKRLTQLASSANGLARELGGCLSEVVDIVGRKPEPSTKSVPSSQ
jgi:hypothetical protein